MWIRSALCGMLILGQCAGAHIAWAKSRFTVGAEAWNTQIAGNVYNPDYPDFTRIGLRDDLNMGRHWNPNFVFATFAMPGDLPDIRLEYGTLIGDGFNSAQREICYNGTTYEANGQVVSQAAVKQGRILFYWSPVDNGRVNLRLGAEARWVSLNLALTGTVTVGSKPQCAAQTVQRGTSLASLPRSDSFKYSTSAGVVAWLPDFNLGLTVHLPGHFDLYFDGSGLPHARSYLYDFRIGFKYRFSSGLGIAVGYRRWRLHLDDTSLSVNGNMDFKGPYAGLYWSF
jgi:hypothetical protein